MRDTPLDKLKPLVREWHRLALPTIRTKPFDETWADFVEAHGNVDLTRCVDAVEQAMKRVDAGEVPLEALEYESPLAQRLVALCAVMSRDFSDDDVFFIACRTAANAIGTVDFKLAANLLKMLCVDGVLQVVERGGPHNNQATRYRYLGPNGKQNH